MIFKAHLISIALILLFALYQSIYLLIQDKVGVWMKVLAVVVLVCVVVIGFRRDTYLPFLGVTVMPSSLLKKPEPAVGNIATKLYLDVADGTAVVYWASQPSDAIFEDPFTAYAGYKNANVAIVKNKQADLVVDCPSKYKIPSGRVLQPHVHYRVVDKKGLLGPVQTVYVTCG